MLYGAADWLGSKIGAPPLYCPIVAKPNEFGLLNTPECWDGYLGLVPEGVTWRNEIAGRSLLYPPHYRAVAVADRVRVPVLIMAGIRDSLVSIEDARILAGKLGDCELEEVDCDHFQPYYPPYFDRFASRQTEFFRAKLS
jgi:fermentation-respiration switch protein FrsA (DUF1100 family)